jgi:hypothetical protein
MTLPARFKVRTLMAIIAVVAVGFGVAFEVKNHVERDQILRFRADNYRQVAIHFRRALECKRAAERLDPYPPAERARLLSGDGLRMQIPPGGFKSWEHELLNHQYWGSRIFDVTDSLEARLEAIEARLLISGNRPRG